MKIERFEEIKAFIAGVVTSLVFYAAGLFMTPHILHLRHPRLFVAGFFIIFFLSGACFRFAKRKKSHSKKLLIAFKTAGFAVIAMSIAAIIKMSAIKEFMESLLYGWRYFLILPEYVRNFSADCMLLAVIIACPVF
ncbi:MAG: hypothetical protein Q8O01_04185, partial [Candidatus Omnitrophota bacterium]|nr:hypothetical protein [Candidatus Omnitrophota bacterium]